MSMVGPSQSPTSRWSTASAGRVQRSTGSAVGSVVEPDDDGRAAVERAGEDGGEGLVGHRVAPARTLAPEAREAGVGCERRPPCRHRRRCPRRSSGRRARRVHPARSRARWVSANVVSVDIGTSTRWRTTSGSRRASAHQPPSVAGASAASWSSSSAATAVSDAALTCGVSMPTCTTTPVPASAWALTSRSAKPSPRCGVIVHPARAAVIRSPCDGVGEVAGEAQVALGSGERAGLEGVEQRGGGQLGGRCVTDEGAQPGLHEAGDRRLGHDQDLHRSTCASGLVRSTRAKSRAVRRVPADRAGHLRAGALGAWVVGHVVLGDPPAGAGDRLQQLDGVAEAAVLAGRGRASPAGRTRASARCRGPPSRWCAAARRR